MLGKNSDTHSEAKLRFLFTCLDSSDSNGGPGHRTKFSAVGDDDQSIHGWSGGLSNAFERLTDMIAKREGLPVGDPAVHNLIQYTTMNVSLRCPKLVVALANETYMAAFAPGGYAEAAECPRNPNKPLMVAADDAIDGLILPDQALLGLGTYVKPGETAALVSRRGLEATQVYPLLKSRAVPCKLNVSDKPTETPLASCRALLRDAYSRGARTVAQLMELVPDQGFPPKVDPVTVKCLKAVVAGAGDASEVGCWSLAALGDHVEDHFSESRCDKLKLMTVHMAKGMTFDVTIFMQYSLFPLERAVQAGGVNLSQEPRIEYVGLTRTRRAIVFLLEFDQGEENNMEQVYFEL